MPLFGQAAASLIDPSRSTGWRSSAALFSQLAIKASDFVITGGNADFAQAITRTSNLVFGWPERPDIRLAVTSQLPFLFQCFLQTR